MYQVRASTTDTGNRLAEVSAGALLIAAMAFGGGSRGIGDAIVTLFALPVALFACARWSWRTQSTLQRCAALLLIAAAVWHVVQLIPLPASVITRLPMRAAVLADLRVAGAEPAWLPATLDTWGILRSLMALLVFGALWSLLCTLTSGSRLRLMKLVVVAGCAMALLGYAQAAAGTRSLLRPYDYHHAIGALGTFANRNHFACLMAMLVPVALALAAQGRKNQRLEATLWHASAVLLLLAAGLSFSRTGFVLACMAALVSLLSISAKRKRTVIGAALLVLAGAGLISIYAWNGLSARLQQDPLQDLRWQYLRYGWEAAMAYFPWGSGPGSFRYAYAPFEPLSRMVNVYALHAHNDFIEIAVESGLPGILLISAVIVLLVIALRRRFVAGGDRPPIVIGSAISVVVPTLHSLVDYPMRTYAVMAVCALVSSVVLSAAGRSSDRGG